MADDLAERIKNAKPLGKAMNLEEAVARVASIGEDAGIWLTCRQRAFRHVDGNKIRISEPLPVAA